MCLRARARTAKTFSSAVERSPYGTDSADCLIAGWERDGGGPLRSRTAWSALGLVARQHTVAPAKHLHQGRTNGDDRNSVAHEPDDAVSAEGSEVGVSLSKHWVDPADQDHHLRTEHRGWDEPLPGADQGEVFYGITRADLPTKTAPPPTAGC